MLGLDRYNLGIKNIEDVDLSSCYMQQRPNQPFGRLLLSKSGKVLIGTNGAFLISSPPKKEGIIDSKITNSPHYELAKMILEEGERKTRKIFKETRYYQMCKILGKKNFPEKIFGLIKSLEKGYLHGKHKKDFITILTEPFAKSRYNRNVEILVPEIWSGHHRAGILLALGQSIVPVAIAQDKDPGSCKSAGKIHGLCIYK
tara:strand:+ start:1755 stop:2357 length:603 start_codon:yes stop_codon:yes gene_type:complete